MVLADEDGPGLRGRHSVWSPCLPVLCPFGFSRRVTTHHSHWVPYSV